MSTSVVRKPIRAEPLGAEFPGLHFVDDQERAAVLRVLDKKCLYRYYGIEPQGEVHAFEEEFAEYVGVKHALGVTSGTAALHTALAALGVGPGQEVIIPAYFWISVAAAVVNLGAIPVLADIDDTFCLSPKSVEAQITERTRGVIVVHMNGCAADVPALLEIARRRGLFLLEDCAQCVGGRIGGRSVGSFGDISTFSFQFNKNMTSGEGGCVATNDERLYRRAIACHDLGYARDASGRVCATGMESNMWGMGYRMDELRAAILRVQLQKLPRVVGHMRASKYRLREALSAWREIGLRRVLDPNGDTGGFLITTYREGETARTVCRVLRENGIVTASAETSAVILANYGLHIYSNVDGLVRKASVDGRGTPWTLQENRFSTVSYERGTCPVADDLFERTLLMTIPSCLSEDDEADILAGYRCAAEVLGFTQAD